MVQPSGDGWALGVVLEFPVLRDCGWGPRTDALLELSYDVPGGSEASLSIPFKLECLDELEFDGDTPPSPRPVDSTEVTIGDLRIVTYFAGSFIEVGGQPRIYLAAVDAAGAVTDWNPNADPGTHLYDLVATDDAVYVAGDMPGLVAYDLAGARLPWSPNVLDNRTSVPFDGLVSALAVDGDVVYAGGYFAGVGGEARNGLAALDVRGQLLPWSPNPGPGAVLSLAVTGERVAALNTSFLGVQAFEAGSGSLAWQVASDNTVYALASDGGLIYVGGVFQTIGGVPRERLAALDANGVVTPWNPGVNDDIVQLLAAHSGVVYAQGSFSTVGGQPREGLAAISSAGAILPWAARVPIAYTMTATESAVYLGTAISVNDEGTGYGGLVKLDLAGNWIPWKPALPGSDAPAQVYALAVDDANAYVGGTFGWNVGYHNLSAFTAAGEPVPWRHNPNNNVRSLLIQGSRLWVGGEFSSMDAYPAQGFTMIER